jgi:hypothetical protein
MLAAGTAVLAADCDDEYTVTMRAFELGFAMGRHDRRYTVKRVAEEFVMSPSGAYRLLSRASGSRRVMVLEIDGEWYVPTDELEWPY